MGEQITNYRQNINKEREKINRQTYITISLACIFVTIGATVYSARNGGIENNVVACVMILTNSFFMIFNSILVIRNSKSNRRKKVGSISSSIEMIALYMVEAVIDAYMIQRNMFLMTAVICTAICIGINLSFSSSKLAEKKYARTILTMMVGVPTIIKVVRSLVLKQEGMLWNILGFVTVEVTVAASIVAVYHTLKTAERIAAIEASKSSEYMDDAFMDDLTGLKNYRKLNRDLTKLNDSRTIMTLVMMDIDNFKKINDTYGHPFGNVVLERLGSILKRYETTDEDGNERKNTDFRAYRYGGEEFAVILANEEAISAEIVSNQIREEIANIKFRENVSITISVGYSVRKDNLSEDRSKSMIDMLNEADRALYIVKKSGYKNRVLRFSLKELLEEEKRAKEVFGNVKSEEYTQLLADSIEKLSQQK